MKKQILLAALSLVAALCQGQAVTVDVDVTRNNHAINPNIYGLAFASTAQLNDLNAPLNRWGGNPTSRYNWRQNVDNRAADWFFESIPYASNVEGAEADSFVQSTKNGNAQVALTIPIIDWIAKAGPGRAKLASFSVAKYGAQQSTDIWFPDAGNGKKPNGTPITGNDPNDANLPNSGPLQTQWVSHLVQKWGPAQSGGVRYYLLDNESSIWFSTHRDVAPVGLSMDRAAAKMIYYSKAIKLADPNALVVGPEEWGWSGYIFSGLDQQTGAANGWSSFPDRNAHGGMDYMPWLLNQMRLASQAAGKRLLDVFSLHMYPQGGEFSNDVSDQMKLRRNRSTRALWDPNYIDETWINDKVKLIPRMKAWVSQYYPGTPTAINEYNWGAEGDMNGATAQADILGIFGREGLDMASRWTTPATNSPAYLASKMYRNYDGARHAFGETSVYAGVPNPDEVAAFASKRSADGYVTVMVINKRLSGSTPLTVRLTGITKNRVVQVYQLKSGSTSINHLANSTTSGNQLTATLPAQSVTLYVITTQLA